MGAASGPIFDELARGYDVSTGAGSEPAVGYDILIYDGHSLTPGDIDDADDG